MTTMRDKNWCKRARMNGNVRKKTKREREREMDKMPRGLSKVTRGHAPRREKNKDKGFIPLES